MAKTTERKPSGLVEVQCPCCEAMLRIDIETKSVITHKVKEKPAPVEDLSAAVLNRVVDQGIDDLLDVGLRAADVG